MKILFAASEAVPFIKTGGLGDVAGALPGELNKLEADCRVILPLYGDIAEKYRSTMSYVGNLSVPVSWRQQYCGIFEQTIDGVKYYFIDNEYYFKRSGIYGFYDDAERFAFFSRAILEVLPVIDFYPDVLHANDWHTALVPVFLDAFYIHKEEYKNIKTLFTIHNIEFQGKYGKDIIKDVLGLPEYKESIVEYGNCVNFLKGAIESANAVSTVSKSYASEILDSFYAYGLESILKEREYKISGVVNGIDVNLYNPKKDKALFKNYDKKTVLDKAENKKGLCEMLNITYNENTPIIAMITRLTEQKGVDLVIRVIEDILSRDVQLIVLGTGDWRYETKLRDVESRYASKMRALITFSADLANKLYASSDMFLMPSKFEPCGLSQMIAMRYGTVPIVRETGGLRDTVIPFDGEKGTGFTFYSYNAYDMLGAIDRAIAVFGDKEQWAKLVANDMKADFSWKKSAKEYMKTYEKLVK